MKDWRDYCYDAVTTVLRVLISPSDGAGAARNLTDALEKLERAIEMVRNEAEER